MAPIECNKDKEHRNIGMAFVEGINVFDFTSDLYKCALNKNGRMSFHSIANLYCSRVSLFLSFSFFHQQLSSFHPFI